MPEALESRLLPRHVHAETRDPATGEVTLTLHDAEVVLDPAAHAAWCALVQSLSAAGAPQGAAVPPPQAVDAFRAAGLLVDAGTLPRELDGAHFHAAYFQPLLQAWLAKAFSHPFWARMMEGRGSARLYAGWLFELYHYTRNANRHMPLAAAHCRNKPVKALLAQHYEEEWSHYHFFSRAARAMGFAAEEVTRSQPLPMTAEMADFMRQAARTDVLCYAACSAVLEGTTTDGSAYTPFYERMQSLYGVPEGAVKPIYDHLALDAQYQHADLFAEICRHEGTLTAERASRVLDFGHQMVEHIWLWTDEIERWYGDPARPMPRMPFDPRLD